MHLISNVVESPRLDVQVKLTFASFIFFLLLKQLALECVRRCALSETNGALMLQSYLETLLIIIIIIIHFKALGILCWSKLFQTYSGQEDGVLLVAAPS